MTALTSSQTSIFQRYDGVVFHFRQRLEFKQQNIFTTDGKWHTVEAGLLGGAFVLYHSQMSEVFERDFCQDDEGRIVHATQSYFNMNLKYFIRTSAAFNYARRLLSSSPIEQLERERRMKIYESNPDGTVRSCDRCAGRVFTETHHW